MPIYEYRCESCDKVSEKLVRNGKEPTACPECGAESLKRLISRAGIIFKGSGFYVTDSKSSSNGAGTSAKSDSSTKSESTSSDTSSKSETSSSSSSDSKSASTSSAD